MVCGSTIKLFPCSDFFKTYARKAKKVGVTLTVLVSEIRRLEDAGCVSGTFGRVWRYRLHCNEQEKCLTEGTLDKVDALTSRPIGLVRKFLQLMSFVYVQLASEKDTCKTCTPLFAEKFDSM